VAREQVVEVARLGRVRHFLELPEPAHLVVGVAFEKFVEHGAVVDLGDGCIDIGGLAIERPDRELVVLGGLRIGVQLGEGIGNREVGFLNG
jgi:hypothetical protein